MRWIVPAVLLSTISSARAESLFGVVHSESGQPIKGAVVNVVGVGNETTTDTGQFRLQIKKELVGAYVRVHVEKPGWALYSPYDRFVVPAKPHDPVLLKMRKATAIEPPRPPADPMPTVSLSALTESGSGEFDVGYDVSETSGLLKIEPRVGYLMRLQGGGPISPVSWDPSKSPFNPQMPALDVKVVNNTTKTIVFDRAVFQIERSKLDVTPIFMIPDSDLPRIRLVNLGWGDLQRCTLRFNIDKAGSDPVTQDVYKHKLEATRDINRCGDGNLLEALKVEGLDTDLLQRRKAYRDGVVYRAPDGSEERLSRDELRRHERQALGRFSDGRALVRGVIEYVDRDGRSGAIKFSARVLLQGDFASRVPIRMGLEPSVEYNVKFDAERANYEIAVPISNALKPGDFDRFTFRIAADKSSIHTFKLRLRFNANKELVSRKIRLGLFTSTADQNLLKHSQNMKDAAPAARSRP